MFAILEFSGRIVKIYSHDFKCVHVKRKLPNDDNPKQILVNTRTYGLVNATPTTIPTTTTTLARVYSYW